MSNRPRKRRIPLEDVVTVDDDINIAKRANTFEESIVLQNLERMALTDYALSPFDNDDAAASSSSDTLNVLPKEVLLLILQQFDLATITRLCTVSQTFRERVCGDGMSPLERERERLLYAVDQLALWQREADVQMRDARDMIVDYALSSSKREDTRYLPELWAQLLDDDFDWSATYDYDRRTHASRMLALWRTHAVDAMQRYAVQAALNEDAAYRQQTYQLLRDRDAALARRYLLALRDNSSGVDAADIDEQYWQIDPNAYAVAQRARLRALRQFYMFNVDQLAVDFAALNFSEPVYGLLLVDVPEIENLRRNDDDDDDNDDRKRYRNFATTLPVAFLVATNVTTASRLLRLHPQLFISIITKNARLISLAKPPLRLLSERIGFIGSTSIDDYVEKIYFFGDNTLCAVEPKQTDEAGRVIDHFEAQYAMLVCHDAVGQRYVANSFIGGNFISVADDSDSTPPSAIVNNDVLAQQMRRQMALVQPSDVLSAETALSLVFNATTADRFTLPGTDLSVLTDIYYTDAANQIGLSVHWTDPVDVDESILTEQSKLPFSVQARRSDLPPYPRDADPVFETVVSDVQWRANAVLQQAPRADAYTQRARAPTETNLTASYALQPRKQFRFVTSPIYVKPLIDDDDGEPTDRYAYEEPVELAFRVATRYYSARNADDGTEELFKSNYVLYVVEFPIHEHLDDGFHSKMRRPDLLRVVYFRVDSRRSDEQQPFSIESIQLVEVFQDLRQLWDRKFFFTVDPLHESRDGPKQILNRTFFHYSSKTFQLFEGRQLRWMGFERRPFNAYNTPETQAYFRNRFVNTIHQDETIFDGTYYVATIFSWDIVSNQLVAFEWVPNQTVPVTYRNAVNLQVLGEPATVRTQLDWAPLAQE